jgi:hypothetical protein
MLKISQKTRKKISSVILASLGFIVLVTPVFAASDVDFGIEVDGDQCLDGVDNDSDGFIDFPDDPDCESAEDDSEESDTPPPGGGTPVVSGGGGILFTFPGEDEEQENITGEAIDSNEGQVDVEETDEIDQTSVEETDQNEQEELVDQIAEEDTQTPLIQVSDIVDSISEFIQSLGGEDQEYSIFEQVDNDTVLFPVEITNSEEFSQEQNPLVVVDGRIVNYFNTVLPDSDSMIVFVLSILGLFFVGHMVLGYVKQPNLGKKCHTGILAVVSGVVFLSIAGFLFFQMTQGGKLYHVDDISVAEIRATSSEVNAAIVVEYRLYQSLLTRKLVDTKRRVVDVVEGEMTIESHILFEDLHPGLYNLDIYVLTQENEVLIAQDAFTILQNSTEQHRTIAYSLLIISFLTLLARGLCTRFAGATPPLGE